MSRKGKFKPPPGRKFKGPPDCPCCLTPSHHRIKVGDRRICKDCLWLVRNNLYIYACACEEAQKILAAEREYRSTI